MIGPAVAVIGWAGQQPDVAEGAGGAPVSPEPTPTPWVLGPQLEDGGGDRQQAVQIEGAALIRGSAQQGPLLLRGDWVAVFYLQPFHPRLEAARQEVGEQDGARGDLNS